MTTVAVVEDERYIADNWGVALADAGYKVRKFYAATAALEALARDPPDILIVDHHLADTMPDLDGYGLLRELRREWSVREANVKVIMVSALHTDLVDRVVGGNVADEFMKKEIGDAPLLLQLVDKVSRSDTLGPDSNAVRRSGHLLMDRKTQICRWRGKEVKLTRSEWAIMWALLENPGTLKSRGDLAKVAYVDSDGIRDIILNIRQKFKKDDTEFISIENVPRVGYKFQDGSQDQNDVLTE